MGKARKERSIIGTGKKEAAYQPAGDAKRIIPLKNGWAYIWDERGALRHLLRDSEEFITACQEVEKALGDGRIMRELKQLGWDDVIERFN